MQHCMNAMIPPCINYNAATNIQKYFKEYIACKSINFDNWHTK